MKGIKGQLEASITAARVPFFGMLFAGLFYALFRTDWTWKMLAFCVVVSVVVAGTIGKASGRFLIFLLPIMCIQMAILMNRILEEIGRKNFAKWILVFLTFFPSYFAIAHKTVGLYEHEVKKTWLTKSVNCLKLLDISQEQSIGLFDYPRPNTFPPFPFLGSTLVFPPNIKVDYPDFVVVRDLAKDVDRWEMNPARQSYGFVCDIVGAFSPVNAYEEQTASIYRKKVDSKTD